MSRLNEVLTAVANLVTDQGSLIWHTVEVPYLLLVIVFLSGAMLPMLARFCVRFVVQHAFIILITFLVTTYLSVTLLS